MQNIESTRIFIDSSNSLNYTLSIRIMSNGFCFCVCDNVQKKFIFFKNHSFELSQQLPIIYQIKRIIDFEPLFTFSFGKIIIVYCGQNYTLLPHELYDHNFKKDLLKFNHPLYDEEEVKDYKINGTDTVNLYSLPRLYADYFQQKFPNAIIHHQASLLIFDALRQTEIEKQVHIDVTPDFFYANVVEGDKLILSNTNSYSNTDEFIYHIVNLFDKLQLHPSETKLYLSGEIEQDSPEMNVLKDYIQHILFAEQSNFSFIPDFQTIASHQMSKLYVSCEL